MAIIPGKPEKHIYSNDCGKDWRIYDPDRCAADLNPKMDNSQCLNKPGHGPGGLYCWLHAKQAEAEWNR